MKAARRIRVVFVLSQLVQHGSERYLFEICQALDKDRFEVEVLTRKAFVRHHYYYDKLRALGIPVHCKLISRRYLTYFIRRLYAHRPLVRRVVDRLHDWMVRREFGNWFDAYDLVGVIGIETYCDAVKPVLAGHPGIVIHHVSNVFQFERDYFAECDQRRLIVLDREQEAELRNSPLAGAELFYLPLSMALPDDVRDAVPARADGPARIAYVSRMYPDRPNEPVFKCFAALAEKRAATLFVYGGGRPEIYTALLDELGVRERVRFMGHQDDIEAALRRDEVSLVWLTSNGPSLGYGSIEVAALGVPMAFWNLSADSYETVLRETGGAVHSFSAAAALVDFTEHLLDEPSRLRDLGVALHRHVRATHDIGRYIRGLETYYAGVASRSRT